MQKFRWLRPSLAFLIAFGLMAIVGSVLRVVVVYQHFFSLGMRPDDPDVATEATKELSRLDHLYTPTFLLVAAGVSLLAAGVFAWWRPKRAVSLPPPLPTERRAETR